MEEKRLPKKFNEIKEKLDKTICTIEYKSNMRNPLAFTYRNIGERLGHSFKIVCNNDCEELKPFLLSHEAGHILFNHCVDLSVSDMIIQKKINACWEKIKDYFKDRNLDEVFNYFENYLYNVTMDWEVNSKFLDLEEIEYMEKIASSYLNEKVEFLYPTRNNYPEGKTWMEYITYILLDPEKFLKNMTDNDSSKNGDRDNKNKKDGNNQGEGDSQNQSENDKQQGGKSLKDLPKKQQKEIIDEFFNKIKKAKEEKEAEEKEIEENGDKEENIGDLNAPSYSPLGKTAQKIDECIENYDNSSLEELLIKCLKNEALNRNKKDIVYYYNRRKYGTNVLYTKYKNQKKILHNKDLCVLLDVSGSVSKSDILSFVNCFKNVSLKLRKKCNIILWNTDKVAEYSSDDKITPFSGGGTDIGKGLEYIQNNKKYYNNSIVVVSDFADSLEDWHFNRKIYGICWDSHVGNYIKDNDDLSEFRKMFKKIFIKENNID